jgi:hypothetical protein
VPPGATGGLGRILDYYRHGTASRVSKEEKTDRSPWRSRHCLPDMAFISHSGPELDSYIFHRAPPNSAYSLSPEEPGRPVLHRWSRLFVPGPHPLAGRSAEIGPGAPEQGKLYMAQSTAG